MEERARPRGTEKDDYVLHMLDLENTVCVEHTRYRLSPSGEDRD